MCGKLPCFAKKLRNWSLETNQFLLSRYWPAPRLEGRMPFHCHPCNLPVRHDFWVFHQAFREKIQEKIADERPKRALWTCVGGALSKWLAENRSAKEEWTWEVWVNCGGQHSFSSLLEHEISFVTLASYWNILEPHSNPLSLDFPMGFWP